MRRIEWQLIKDLGAELCIYTLTSPSIRLPICQPQSAAGRSLVTQCCQAECLVCSSCVTPGSYLSCVLLAKDGGHLLTLIFIQVSRLQSLPSLPGNCLFFFFNHSFPGFPNPNSLCTEAEFVISLLGGFLHPFMNWRMQDMPSVFKPGIVNVYRSTPWSLQQSSSRLLPGNVEVLLRTSTPINTGVQLPTACQHSQWSYFLIHGTSKTFCDSEVLSWLTGSFDMQVWCFK